MPTFQIEERALERFDKDCPEGYIAIASSNPLDRHPAYWGSVLLASQGQRCRFYYLIDGFDYEARTYEFAAYRDKEMSDCGFALKIFYIDGEPKGCDAHLIESKTGNIPDEVCLLVHMLAQGSMMSLRLIYQGQFPLDPRSYMEEGCCIRINPSLEERFESMAGVPLSAAISNLDLLLA